MSLRPTNKLEFSRKLRRLRHEAGKTLKEVSEYTGFPVSTLSYMESGSSNFDVLSKYARLARCYGMTFEGILGDREINSAEEERSLEDIITLLTEGQVNAAKAALLTIVYKSHQS